MHVKSASNVAYHCFVHALSQADTIFFEDTCPHDHTYHCLQCYQLEETLTAVTKMTADMEWDNPEAYLFKVCDPYLSQTVPRQVCSKHEVNEIMNLSVVKLS